MFKLALSPTFWATVRVEVTNEDGRRVEGKFDVQYKRLDLTQMRDLTERNRSGDLSDNVFIHEVVNSWRGVTDDDGGELTFSTSALDKMLEAGLGQAILTTFFESFPKAKAKN